MKIGEDWESPSRKQLGWTMALALKALLVLPELVKFPVDIVVGFTVVAGACTGMLLRALLLRRKILLPPGTETRKQSPQS